MKRNIQKNRIMWEKFKNPYEDIDMEMEEEVDEYDDAYEEQEKKHQKIQPVILTPQGPIGIYRLTDDVMNFWIVHTTFRLTGPIMKLVSKTSGVESVEVYTPYRMRIGVGKLFPMGNVKSEIDNSINTLLYPNGSG